MASINDITKDSIHSGVYSDVGRENHDRIFSKKSSVQWLNECGYSEQSILDPDGWRQNDGVDMNTPITKSDFNRRFNASTVLLQLPKIDV